MTSPTSIMIAASAPSHLAEARDSTLLQNAYLRFRVVEDNRMAGDQGRALHGTLLLLKARQEEAYRTEASERAQERYDRARRSRLARKHLLNKSRQQAEAARKAQAADRRLLEQRRSKLRDEVRQRVLEANVVHAAASTAAEYARHAQREEGTKQRAAAAKILAAMRQESLAHNKATAARVRDERGGGGGGGASAAGLTSAASSGGEAGAVDSVMGLPAAPTGLQAAAAAARKGVEARELSKALGQRRGRLEEQYIQQARLNRERALATRQAARTAVADTLGRRRAAAARERAQLQRLAADERTRTLEANRQEVVQIYKARWASAKAAQEYDTSRKSGTGAALFAARLGGLKRLAAGKLGGGRTSGGASGSGRSGGGGRETGASGGDETAAASKTRARSWDVARRQSASGGAEANPNGAATEVAVDVSDAPPTASISGAPATPDPTDLA